MQLCADFWFGRTLSPRLSGSDRCIRSSPGDATGAAGRVAFDPPLPLSFCAAGERGTPQLRQTISHRDCAAAPVCRTLTDQCLERAAERGGILIAHQSGNLGQAQLGLGELAARNVHPPLRDIGHDTLTHGLTKAGRKAGWGNRRGLCQHFDSQRFANLLMDHRQCTTDLGILQGLEPPARSTPAERA